MNGISESMLDGLADSLNALSVQILNSTAAAQTLSEAVGWNAPSLDRFEMANAAGVLAHRIRESMPIGTLDDDASGMIVDYAKRIDYVTAHTVPQLWNGSNAPQAAAALLLTLFAIESGLTHVLKWPVAPAIGALPPKLLTRIKAAQLRVEDIETRSTGLDEKVQKILDAHETADALPLDLEALKDAREKLGKLEVDSGVATQHIKDAADRGQKLVDDIKVLEVRAQALVAKCEDAYRITTSTGLAGAFDERARKLNFSMVVWAVGLILSLAIGAYLGGSRVEMLTTLVSNEVPNWGGIALQMVLSVVAVGAPLWFAWLATKQVGQRFRLSEDYAFKASVAKAYEGYRKEAVSLDAAFEARLFSAALTRLEEAPLRLLADEKISGSPWHEVLNSDALREKISIVPELRERLVDLLRDAKLPFSLNKSNGKSSAPAKPLDE